MTGKHTVTERVWADHPNGYKVLVAVPGQEISLERAVELGLVEAEPEVSTAEVRRNKPASPRKKAASKSEAADPDADVK